MGRARRFGVCHLTYRTHLSPLTETSVLTPQLGSHMPVNSSRSLKSLPASTRSQNLQALAVLADAAASHAVSRSSELPRISKLHAPARGMPCPSSEREQPQARITSLTRTKAVSEKSREVLTELIPQFLKSLWKRSRSKASMLKPGTAGRQLRFRALEPLLQLAHVAGEWRCQISASLSGLYSGANAIGQIAAGSPNQIRALRANRSAARRVRRSHRMARCCRERAPRAPGGERPR